MLKKVSLLFISVLLLAVFFVSAVHSEAIDSVADQLEAAANRVENVTNTVDSLVNNPSQSREELKKAYLKTEWEKLLKSKPYIGPVIRAYEKISPYTDPIIEYCVGLAPSLSWYFLLLLGVWIVLVKYFYSFYEVLRDFSTFTDLTSAIVSFCFFIILLVLHLFQNISIWVADKFVALISSIVDNILLQVILVVAGILLLIIAGKFSKEVKVLARYIRMLRYRHKQDREEADRISRQEAATRKSEAYAKALGKGV